MISGYFVDFLYFLIENLKVVEKLKFFFEHFEDVNFKHFPRDPIHFSAEVCEGPTPNSRVRPAVRFVPLDPTKTAQGVRNVTGHTAKTAHHKNHNKIGQSKWKAGKFSWCFCCCVELRLALPR